MRYQDSKAWGFLDMTDKAQNRKEWAKVSISSLEADVAYFDARLAMLGEDIESHYQYAQLKAYKELERILKEILARLEAKPKRKKRTRKKTRN